jgi:hypothetical protein
MYNSRFGAQSMERLCTGTRLVLDIGLAHVRFKMAIVDSSRFADGATLSRRHKPCHKFL